MTNLNLFEEGDTVTCILLTGGAGGEGVPLVVNEIVLTGVAGGESLAVATETNRLLYCSCWHMMNGSNFDHSPKVKVMLICKLESM